ncbi:MULTISPECIES: ABC transporter ATP-binding protein [Streptomyces]|uniref:ABC transporter ATP-binding protein n=1 Tax=Streptomyces TaxID=1883 RepID=UPI001E4AF379|nr:MULTISPECIES: ABC transporter ATP-binding protein [Streptomyces]UFQ18166.1 ABC transporter ATP-binding protein/permease [Streptomyces huasconensis]WCL87778.1 ABC transporter ATP-binding protein [Streptomyces sp. JCM 35825]
MPKSDAAPSDAAASETPASEVPASEAAASEVPAKGRSTVRSLLRLWPYVRPVRTRLIAAAVVAVIASCTGLLFPLVLKWMVDGPVADGDEAGVWLGALLLLLLGVTEALLFGLRRWLVARPLASVEAAMRADLFRHLQRLPVAFHDRWASGQLLSRGTTDLMLLRMFLAFPLTFLLVNGATIVVGVIILLGQDFMLGLVLLAPVAPMVIVCAYYEGRYTAVARRAQDQVGDLTTVVEESVLGIRIIKGFGRHRSQARAFRELSHTLRGTELAKARILAAIYAVIMSLPEAAIGAALVLGTVRVADGGLSAGTLVAFLSTALALRWPVESIGFLLAMTQESATATERYFEVMDAEPEGGASVVGGAKAAGVPGGGAPAVGGAEAAGVPGAGGTKAAVAPGGGAPAVGGTEAAGVPGAGGTKAAVAPGGGAEAAGGTEAAGVPGGGAPAVGGAEATGAPTAGETSAAVTPGGGAEAVGGTKAAVAPQDEAPTADQTKPALGLADGTSAAPGGAAPSEVGGLRFHGVEFRYPDAPPDAPPVLSHVDLHIRPGETMALVGATGSGKTTLTALVPRLHEVSGGRITLDGEDITAMERERLRALVAVAFEEPTLFSATVGENVLMGAEDGAGEAELARALDVAQADFVHALPQGTDTQVGEQGLSLSGGQRQRLALARAVVGRPRFLVLDDPLSALDVHTEALVEAALRRVLADTTALVVAHRPSTVQLADRVALLSGGRVAAVGTHQELLRENAEYAWLMSGAEATETTDAAAEEATR